MAWSLGVRMSVCKYVWNSLTVRCFRSSDNCNYTKTRGRIEFWLKSYKSTRQFKEDLPLGTSYIPSWFSKTRKETNPNIWCADTRNRHGVRKCLHQFRVFYVLVSTFSNTLTFWACYSPLEWSLFSCQQLISNVFCRDKQHPLAMPATPQHTVLARHSVNPSLNLWSMLSFRFAANGEGILEAE